MKIFQVLWVLMFSHFSFAQKEIAWTFKQYKKTIKCTATIQPGWRLYAINLKESGPIPTSFSFDDNPLIELIGMDEPKPIIAFDPNFETEVGYYENKVEFIQKIKVLKNTVLKGGVTYMICNDEMCLPPVDHRFEVKLKKK